MLNTLEKDAEKVLSREEREEIVRSTLANNEIEGIDTPDDVVEMFQSFIEGEITLEEIYERTVSKYAPTP